MLALMPLNVDADANAHANSTVDVNAVTKTNAELLLPMG